MSKTINISYFLNPYCFYFKFDDDLHDSSLQSLEDKISKYACDEIKQNNNEKPSIAVGDVVVAYLIPWSKWVRAVVRCDFDRLKCYELWAIDHGKVFRAAYKNVVKLPESLAKEEFAGIRRGSFYGVAPAKLDFNLDTCKSEHRPIENWSSKAIKQCTELLNNDDITEVSFAIETTCGNCYFGDISIATASNTLCNMVDALKQIDEAVDIEFEPEIDRIEAKYRKSHLKDCSDFMNGPSVRQLMQAVQHSNRSDTESIIQSTIVPSEIDGGATRMQKRGLKIAPPSVMPSSAQSTIVPSEIDGGATRMQMKRGLKIAPPSVLSSSAQSTIVPSEIDGGATRMQMKRGLKIAPPSEITNGTAQKQMPKKPNRKLATNYVNGNGNNVKRAPMPAGHEPDIDNFTKYNS